MSNLALQPRIIRAGQAPSYCGMCERLFNAEIKPSLTKIQIGVQGVGYDRFEIDEALDDYIARYGRAPKKGKEEHNQCKNEEPPVSGKLMGSGISTKPSTVRDFAKAARRAKSTKQKKS